MGTYPSKILGARAPGAPRIDVPGQDDLLRSSMITDATNHVAGLGLRGLLAVTNNSNIINITMTT